MWAMTRVLRGMGLAAVGYHSPNLFRIVDVA